MAVLSASRTEVYIIVQVKVTHKIVTFDLFHALHGYKAYVWNQPKTTISVFGEFMHIIMSEETNQCAQLIINHNLCLP